MELREAAARRGRRRRPHFRQRKRDLPPIYPCSILRVRTRPPGGEFGPPQPLGEEYAFRPPSIAINAKGEAVAAWQSRAGKEASIKVALKPAGGGFQPPVTLAGPRAEGEGGEVPKVAINDRGDVIVAWFQLDWDLSASRYLTSYRPAGRGFGPPETIWEGRRTGGADVGAAVDPEGVALVAWGTGGDQLVSQRLPNGGFGPPDDVGQQGGGADAFSFDANGNALLFWGRQTNFSSDNAKFTFFAAYRPRGGHFRSAYSPFPTGSWPVGLALDGRGNTLGVWISRRSEGSRVMTVSATRFGPTEPPSVLSPARPRSVAFAANRRGAAAVLYDREDGGGTNPLFFAERPPGHRPTAPVGALLLGLAPGGQGLYRV